MLIEFRVGNFRSFDEPQTFSLVASPDARHSDNCISFGKLQLLKSAAVFGANASGKSNLIGAMGFMRQFVLDSATRMTIGHAIPVAPFQLNPESRSRASFFEVQFAMGMVRYQYGFTATGKRVEDEWLIAYPRGRPQHLFERRFDVQTQQTTWTFRGDLKREETLLKERTRDNGLVLSRGAEFNIAPLTTLLLWFQYDLSVLDLSASPQFLITKTAVRLKDDPSFRERVLRLIRHADLGINDLEVLEEQTPYYFSVTGTATTGGKKGSLGPNTTSFSPVMSGNSDLSFIDPSVLSGVPTSEMSWTRSSPLNYTIRSIHRSAAGEAVRFNFLEAESHGTQRFFALAGPWLDALDQGALLVIDELDCSMHPTLTRKLVELFQTRDANPNGAQLIFSTQDSTLMDLEMFRRDQIWIVEKDRAGASGLSSLYDFEEKPRNNEALQRRYLAGHYGGVPVFGPTFEDLELR